MTAQSNVRTDDELARIKENVELVQRGYGMFNAGDLEALKQLFDEDASWHTPGRSVLAGDRRGLGETFSQFMRYGMETHGTFRAELRYVVADGADRVIAMHHNTGERNGKRLDVDCCIVFQLKDAKVISGSEFFYDLYAWDEFWA